jgi:hypothetical protein
VRGLRAVGRKQRTLGTQRDEPIRIVGRNGTFAGIDKAIVHELPDTRRDHSQSRGKLSAVVTGELGFDTDSIHFEKEND